MYQQIKDKLGNKANTWLGKKFIKALDMISRAVSNSKEETKTKIATAQESQVKADGDYETAKGNLESTQTDFGGAKYGAGTKDGSAEAAMGEERRDIDRRKAEEDMGVAEGAKSDAVFAKSDAENALTKTENFERKADDISSLQDPEAMRSLIKEAGSALDGGTVDEVKEGMKKFDEASDIEEKEVKKFEDAASQIDKRKATEEVIESHLEEMGQGDPEEAHEQAKEVVKIKDPTKVASDPTEGLLTPAPEDVKKIKEEL